jgi:hypothetical protein
MILMRSWQRVKPVKIKSRKKDNTKSNGKSKINANKFILTFIY